MEKQEIIRELRVISRKLNRSPGRREIPYGLYHQCIKQFGSFNNAKIKTGLHIIKRKCDPIPKNCFILTKTLSGIVSYLLFDGHLYKNLRGFALYSTDLTMLKAFKMAVKKQFRLKGKYKFNHAGSHNQTHLIEFFNVRVAQFLRRIGVPSGDKSIIPYRVPMWIKKNKEYSREFLKIAFNCEGSWKENDRSNPRIKFNMHKVEELRRNGVLFMMDLKSMLKKFGIETTPISFYNGKIRKDGYITKELRFRILTKCNNKFIKQIGWYK